jgi:hypothetical protein
VKHIVKIASITLLPFLIFCFPQKTYAAISFSISNPILNSNDEIEVDTTISGLTSSNNCSINGCYLQAELQSAGGNFGYTYNNSGEFVDYFSKPTSTDEIKSKLYNFVPAGGYWSGKLRVKNNPESENYYGPGEYLLSFRRFSGNSLNPTTGDSNGIAVILSVPLPTHASVETTPSTPTPTPTVFTLKTSAPTPNLTQNPASTSTPKPTKSPTLSPIITKENFASNEAGVVLGVENNISPTPISNDNTKEKSSKFPVFPTILIFVGTCFIGVSVFSIIRNAKKDYTRESEDKNSEIS